MATKKAISAGTGRRKTATARVNLVEGKGVWTVNGVAIEEYIPSEALRDVVRAVDDILRNNTFTVRTQLPTRASADPKPQSLVFVTHA